MTAGMPDVGRIRAAEGPSSLWKKSRGIPEPRGMGAG